MSRHPQMYKMPRKPGYLGGYNWRASATGLLFLVGQLDRDSVHCPTLRLPASSGRTAETDRERECTNPSAWIFWGWRYCTSRDERIRGPLEGEMIVFAGSFSAWRDLLRAHESPIAQAVRECGGPSRFGPVGSRRGHQEPPACSMPQGVYVGGWCPRRAHTSTTSATTVRNTFWRSRRRGPAKASASSSRPCSRGRNRRSSTTSRVRTGPGRPASGEAAGISVSSSHRLRSRAVRASTRSPRFGCSRRAMSRRPEHREHDRPHRGGQPAGALLAGCRGFHHHRHDSPRLLRGGPETGGSACLADLAHVFTTAGSVFRETLDELLTFAHDPGVRARMANADRRTHDDTPGRSREGAGDARQRGSGFRRRTLDCEDRTDALQRPAGCEEHVGQRLHHQRSGEPCAAGIPVPGRAAQLTRSACAR